MHAACAATAERELRREKKRFARRRREQARYILQKLETEQPLYLQEVYMQSSHCRAWECSIAKMTREPNIRSYFRFALKDFVKNYHIICMEPLIRSLGDLAANGHLRLNGRASIHEEGKDCWHCKRRTEAPAEPAKRDYCPGKPTAIRLSRLLAVATGLPHIDHWWLWPQEERRGGGVGNPA
ncbi:hypothetical protein BDW66DRAFT_164352 [Aspergillus desertorum]